MKKTNVILGALFIVCFMASTCFASINQFAGSWQNVDKDTRGITKLNIAVSGTKVKVHAWGSCTPSDCDWGPAKALAYGINVSADLAKTANALVADYETDFSETILVITPLGSNLLKVESFTHFTKDKRTDYHSVYKFKPATSSSGTPALQEDCVSFNPKTANIAKIGNNWKIVDGSHWMFDFGSNKAEAVKALQIIKRYGMTKSCFVGRPDPSFEYMLVGNHAPAGSLAGEDCVSFNPNKIAVKQVNGRWKIVEGSHLMFDFGNNKDEAVQAYKIIKQYGFNKSCFVGRPHASFKYLRK